MLCWFPAGDGEEEGNQRGEGEGQDSQEEGQDKAGTSTYIHHCFLP